MWLVLEDGPYEGKIALQKRSDQEKRFKHVCQATWTGKVEENESIDKAVERECEEELGKNFKDNFDFSSLKFIAGQDYAFKGNNWESHNFLGRISSQNLEIARLHEDAQSEFVFVDKNAKVFPLMSAKSPKFDIVMFDDQYKIFKKIIA